MNRMTTEQGSIPPLAVVGLARVHLILRVNQSALNFGWFLMKVLNADLLPIA